MPNIVFGTRWTGPELTITESGQATNSIGSSTSYAGASDAAWAVGAFTGTAGLPADRFGFEWDDYVQALRAKTTEQSGTGIAVYVRSADFTGVGGWGSDIFRIANSGAATISGGAGNDQIFVNLDEAGQLTAGTADQLSGEAGNDHLSGGKGDDTLDGGDGGDFLVGGEGSDTLFGSWGVDTAAYDGSSAGVSIDLMGVSRGGDAEGDRLFSIENVKGSLHADGIAGDGASNELDGALGDDTLLGGAGNDTLWGEKAYEVGSPASGQDNDVLDGGLGIDVMHGGSGDDVYIVDNAGDRVAEYGPAGTDTVEASVSYALDADDSIEVLRTTDDAGTGAIDLAGNERVNTIVGNAGANVLSGGGGSDTLDGRGGLDTVDYRTASGAVTVTLNSDGASADACTGSSSGADGADRLMGIESIRGSRYADTLAGNKFANTLDGGLGADIMAGGRGNDWLRGRAGADTFEFSTALDAGANVDRVVDFASGQGDRIGLNGAIFGAIGATLDASEFVIGARAADAGDRVVYNPATGALSYDADGSGAGEAVRFAVLTSRPETLDLGDFAIL